MVIFWQHKYFSFHHKFPIRIHFFVNHDQSLNAMMLKMNLTTHYVTTKNCKNGNLIPSEF